MLTLHSVLWGLALWLAFLVAFFVWWSRLCAQRRRMDQVAFDSSVRRARASEAARDRERRRIGESDGRDFGDHGG